MKKTITFAVCLAVLFLIVSCKQKPQIDDYAIVKITQPLSNDEMVSAFSALGLTIERFDCMLPQRTGIHLSSEQFVDGQPYGGKSAGTIYLDKGVQRLLFFKKESENRKVDFSLNHESGSIGCGSVSIEDYHASAYGVINIQKITTQKQPLYVFAANRSGIEGFSSQTVDVEPLIDKYDFVMVIYVSIEEH